MKLRGDPLGPQHEWFRRFLQTARFRSVYDAIKKRGTEARRSSWTQDPISTAILARDRTQGEAQGSPDGARWIAEAQVSRRHKRNAQDQDTEQVVQETLVLRYKQTSERILT